MSKKFEHRADYVAIPFKNATSGAWIFKSTEQTLEPDVASLLAEEEQLQKKMLELGAKAGNSSAPSQCAGARSKWAIKMPRPGPTGSQCRSDICSFSSASQ